MKLFIEPVLPRLLETKFVHYSILTREDLNMSSYILGIDISKNHFDVALLIDDKNFWKKFDNTDSGFDKLEKWLNTKDVDKVHACLEATGSYGDK